MNHDERHDRHHQHHHEHCERHDAHLEAHYHGHHGIHGGGGRARRGDAQAAILRLLAEEPMHGYQIIQELSERSGGRWNPGAGSIYPTLQAMEDQGLVTSEQSGDKRIYSLTEEGKAAAAETGRRAPWERFSGSRMGASALHKSARSLAMATAQLVKIGDADDITRATEILDAARRSIYLILAEEDSTKSGSPEE